MKSTQGMTGEQKMWAWSAWPICALIAWMMWLISGCELTRAINAEATIQWMQAHQQTKEAK